MTVPKLPQAADAVLAAGLLAVAVAFDAGPPGRWVVGLLTGTAGIAPLLWRRRAPLVAWGVSTGVTMVAIAAHTGPALGMAPAVLVGLYTVASRYPRRVSVAAAAVTLAGLAGMVATGAISLVVGVRPAGSIAGGGAGWIGFAVTAAAVGGCWLIGDNVRVSRAYVAGLRAAAARAESDRAAELARVESDRAAELARVAAEERNRIARDLHDVVVHHVSVIAVQAGAARLLAGGGTNPGTTRQAWLDVEASARRALTELRQLLGVLRHGQPPPGLAPPPGLDQLDRLLTEVRRAGLPVRSRVEGDPVAVPTAAGLAAYRIVQEALTNVLRHQGRAPTDVAVRYRAGELHLEVTSAAAAGTRPARPAGRGHGLLGMRERVATLGGTLDAGPRPGGGFAVSARIPLPDGVTR